MFQQLYFLLIATLYWQHVASRHIVQQPFYPPYSDYSYTYSGPGPFHQSFQHQHSPFFSPPGTYFDQRQGILRPFPGGGVPVLVDYHKRCSDNFVGLRAHPDQQQYYYVCKPDCVIFGKCQNLQIFNATSNQCAQHPPPEYIPTCTGVGRFPLFSDCHLYFKCDEDLQPKLYSCPISMVFSPASKKCIDGNKCTPTQISPQSSYIPEICATKFPPCFENGIFRSPSDCSLYYKCDLKKNGIYMQTRLKCSQGSFYDLQKKECLPAKEVACDCIQVAELVYPKPNSLPFQPAVYPAQFELDAMIDGQYPVEQTNDGVTETSSDCRKPNEIVTDSQLGGTTTLSPFDLNNELMEQNDFDSTILSDYIDVGERQTTGSNEDLTPVPVQLINSSEETTGTEGSGTESTVTEDNLSAVTAARTEEITQTDTTINTEQEITNEPTVNMEKEELLGLNLEQIETTTTLSETEAKEDEKVTTIRDLSSQSLEPLACENLIENKRTGDADTQTKDTSQTQTKKCLTKLTDMPETQNEQNSTTLTLVTTTTNPTHTPTVKLKTTTENLINSQTITTIPERENLKENLLDSALKLETAGTTQSSEKTLTEIEQVTRQSRADNGSLETENLMTTSQDTIQTHSVHKNSVEQDISYEDLLESEITKKTRAEFSEANNETNLPIFDKEVSTNEPRSKDLESLDLKEIQQISVTETTTTTSSPQATAIQLQSTTSGKELLLAETTEQSTNVPLNTEDDESAVLDSEIGIDDFENTTQSQENVNENAADALTQSQQESISTNEKSVTLRQIDFSDEDFIPVQSKNPKLNEIEEESSLLEKGFDDDYTTVFAENEITTTLASTMPNGKEEKEENNEIGLFDKVTTIKRRQTSLDETIQTTTQISVLGEKLTSLTEQPNEDHREDDETDKFDVLDSEIVIPDQANNEEEVSNNEITSAETNQTTSISNQQKNQISHSPTTTSLTPTTTQIPTTANSKTSTSEPSEKHTNSFILHVRKEDLEQQSTVDSSPTRKSLYYILKTKPVITNNNSSNDSNENNNNNALVAATQSTNPDNREIPRLEIIAQRPIDIHFSICPSTCEKDHKNNKSTNGKRAVLLKWFAGKSKQTLGFETSNEINTEAV